MDARDPDTGVRRLARNSATFTDACPDGREFTTNLGVLPSYPHPRGGERFPERGRNSVEPFNSAINQSGREETRSYKVSHRILLFQPRRTL